MTLHFYIGQHASPKNKGTLLLNRITTIIPMKINDNLIISNIKYIFKFPELFSQYLLFSNQNLFLLVFMPLSSLNLEPVFL